MLALRIDLQPALVADQGRKESSSRECDYQRYRYLRERLLVVPLLDDRAYQYSSLSHFPLLYVWLRCHRVLRFNGGAAYHVVLYEQVHRQGSIQSTDFG